jgi:hypothetical protein
VDLTWDSLETWQQGLIYGATRLVDKKNKGFTFGTLLFLIELLLAACESGTDVFSIEKMNQRNKTCPKAQSIYQRMGGDLGFVFGSLGQKLFS